MLVKRKDANGPRLCFLITPQCLCDIMCFCYGSPTPSMLFRARSLPLHQGWFTLGCLLSSYWGFGRTAAAFCLQSTKGPWDAAGRVKVEHRYVGGQSSTWGQTHRAPFWQQEEFLGLGVPSPSWEMGTTVTMGSADPFGEVNPGKTWCELKKTVPVYSYLQKQTGGRWEKEAAYHRGALSFYTSYPSISNGHFLLSTPHQEQPLWWCPAWLAFKGHLCSSPTGFVSSLVSSASPELTLQSNTAVSSRQCSAWMGEGREERWRCCSTCSWVLGDSHRCFSAFLHVFQTDPEPSKLVGVSVLCSFLLRGGCQARALLTPNTEQHRGQASFTPNP